MKIDSNHLEAVNYCIREVEKKIEDICQAFNPNKTSMASVDYLTQRKKQLLEVYNFLNSKQET